MPFDKTPIVWISSRRHSHVKFLIDVHFCRDPVIFRVLEVIFIFGLSLVSTIMYNKPEGRKKETNHQQNNQKTQKTRAYAETTRIQVQN